MQIDNPNAAHVHEVDRAIISRVRKSDPADERTAFIEAMSRAVTGVTVVTTAGDAGRFGQTVSAMSSVSADPPLLLICLNRRSKSYAPIAQHRVFAVNVLRADQQQVSQIFAGRPQRGQPYDFDAAVWNEGVTGSPLLAGAVARFDCTLEAIHDAGSHGIIVGRVVASSFEPGTPLIYAQRGYGELQSFPRRQHDWQSVPAGFVGDEPDDEPQQWEVWE